MVYKTHFFNLPFQTTAHEPADKSYKTEYKLDYIELKPHELYQN